MIKQILVLLALVSVACGGANSSPTDSTGAPLTVSVVDGRTGIPIPGVPPLQVDSRQAASLSVPGFFARHTVPTSENVSLWPADAALPAEYTRALAYDRQDPGRLVRFAPGITTIGIQAQGVLMQGDLAQDIAAAADIVSRAHDALDYVVGTGQMNVAMAVNPQDDAFQHSSASGVAYTTYDGNRNIVAIRIVFRSADIAGYWYGHDNFRTVVAHELMHTTGLSHCDPAGEQGIMSADGRMYTYRDFTANEKLIMHLQYQRRASNMLAGTQEDDTGLSAASTRTTTRVVTD